MKEMEKIYIGHEVFALNEFCSYSYNYSDLNGCLQEHLYYVSSELTLLRKVGKNKYVHYLDGSSVYELIDPNELVVSRDVLNCELCENFKFKGMLNCANNPDSKPSFVGIIDVCPLSMIDEDIDLAKFIVQEHNLHCAGKLFLQITDDNYKYVIEELYHQTPFKNRNKNIRSKKLKIK